MKKKQAQSDRGKHSRLHNGISWHFRNARPNPFHLVRFISQHFLDNTAVQIVKIGEIDSKRQIPKRVETGPEKT